MEENIRDRLYKITDLLKETMVKIEINVYGGIGYVEEENTITIDMRTADLLFTKNDEFVSAFFNNVEYVDNDREEYENQNPILLCFLHELGHCLSRNFVDFKKYHELKNNIRHLPQKEQYIQYRNIIHEKLADNIGYLVWHFNKSAINKIMNGVNYKITKKIVDNNRLMVYNYIKTILSNKNERKMKNEI